MPEPPSVAYEEDRSASRILTGSSDIGFNEARRSSEGDRLHGRPTQTQDSLAVVGEGSKLSADVKRIPEVRLDQDAEQQSNAQDTKHDRRRPSITNRDLSFRSSSINGNMSPYPEANSTTALLPTDNQDSKPAEREAAARSLRQHEPIPVGSNEEVYQRHGRTATGVRFAVKDKVGGPKSRVKRKINTAQQRASGKIARRNKLREGSIVKMEKMLVRIDTTRQEVPKDFDENESMRTECRTLEKWREYMLVVRKSHTDDGDFRLQMYKSRVIPAIEDGTVKKKPTHEIMLNARVTHVNLFSSLDKTVVIWHPYKKGTRLVVMRPRSTAHSVEWYTFLREVLGWARPAWLQVSVPDLSVALHLDKPFEGLEAARSAEDDGSEEASFAKTMAEEQAAAGKIVKRCIDMLEGNSEWTDVLEKWSQTAKMGLAWKRYDRLEWVYGANEQKMYGSMAMARSHDLELRPKQHYPTNTYGKMGKRHGEPEPVEGFLIRLTSQKGIHERLGKTFFKRLYFHVHNQYLIFNRPAKATPPHPPRLPTISGTNVPSAKEIVAKTPVMFEINPYPIRDGEISWVRSGDREYVERQDGSAFEESQRLLSNISECDGYVNLCRVEQIRKLTWGAAPVDEDMQSGSDSDVDFHQEVPDTRAEDGTTKQIDEARIFELVLENGLIIRLQAYSEETRNEWMQRLKRLVKYWKLRTSADIDLFKTVRKANLEKLNIDEEMEAVLGQFARKWEVARSEASPQLYNMCGISCCRPISMSGVLYHKPRRRATFTRCGVLLTNGRMMLFQGTVRKRTGEAIKHIHQERQHHIDLKDCYVYSGLITEDDLLYQNQTFDSNHPGGHAIPRVYLEDGWTSSDEDTMTCFVVWQALRKSYFRAVVGEKAGGGTRQKLRHVSQLGVPGRSVVFKCRSRAERDHWVLNVGMEIDRLQVDEDVRLEGEQKKTK